VLRSHVQSQLPVYMVPSAFVMLDSLPLTPVGKVDRSALPAPEGERQAGQAYVAPGSELERRIAAIWCEVLGVERVGIDDNFFELGGNSLLLMRLRTLLADQFQRELPVVDLFGFPTVRALAGYCGRQEAGEGVEPEQSGLGKVQERARLRRRALQLEAGGGRSHE